MNRALARTIKRRQVLALVILLTITATGSAENTKGERVVQHGTYSGKYDSFDVSMDRQLIDLGEGKFKLSSSAKNFFASITETETFYWRDATILPIRYEYKQKVFGIKKQRTTEFNWQTSLARYSDGDKVREIELQPGTLGPMSYQLQLQIDVIENKETFEYSFAKRGKLKNYQFVRVSDDKKINPSIGDPVLVRRSSDDGNKQTDVWFDAQKGYALAAIRHTDDGDTYSITLEKEQKYPPLTNTPYQSLGKDKK